MPMSRLAVVLLIVLGSSSASAAPFVFYRGVLNAASFAPQGLPNGSIARGSIFAIFGRDLGPAEGVIVSPFPLGTNFQGVSIEVCQNGACVQAIPLFVRADQINAIMPSNAPLGSVSLRVTFNGEAGNFSPATVAASSFGVFAINSGGFGPGIIQNFESISATPLNSMVAAARPGQVVIAYGTGLGAGLQPDNVPAGVGDLPVEVEVFVGSRKATRFYAGDIWFQKDGVDRYEVGEFDVGSVALTGEIGVERRTSDTLMAVSPAAEPLYYGWLTVTSIAVISTDTNQQEDTIHLEGHTLAGIVAI